MILGEGALKLYMADLARYPLVTREEETRLAAESKGGSEMARLKLIRSNLRLVVTIAHEFTGRGLPLLDLISEGNIGLMEAVGRCDPAKGSKLSSYAAWAIKRAIRKALAEKSRIVRVPATSAARISRLRRIRTELWSKQGWEPADAGTAGEANLTLRTVARSGHTSTSTIPLHAPAWQGHEGELQDLLPDYSAIAPDRDFEDRDLRRRLLELVDRLDQTERTVLTLRFGLNGSTPRPLVDVGKAIGRTSERVRQIQNVVLAKLQAVLKEDETKSVRYLVRR